MHIEDLTETEPAAPELSASPAETPQEPAKESQPAADRLKSYYKIQFRQEEQTHTAASRPHNLRRDEMVMVQTDHGLEPARVLSIVPLCPEEQSVGPATPFTIVRRSTRDEIAKYTNLRSMEDKAFAFCAGQIEKNKLPMRLVKVERFFNGSKIIFYFTAENRVDFRELVKTLVQEFRTRVEMRQIGVRHETMMLGGMGCCGRELCCASFIKNFESVSIKMAKEQNLPLNPVKISGACNRLLCCLNYEFATYKAIRKNMPKVGKRITLAGQTYKVCRHNILKETIQVISAEGKESTLAKNDWLAATVEPVKTPHAK